VPVDNGNGGDDDSELLESTTSDPVRDDSGAAHLQAILSIFVAALVLGLFN
jgi:hypothetical protein